MLKENKGLVFDIQSYSVHDGPGCRTLVFLSGCPLRCQWCANPEGWEYRRRPMLRMSKCVHLSQGCTRCLRACPFEAISRYSDGTGIMINWTICASCETMECTEACLHEALVVCGKWISESELMRILNRDRNFWGARGGVTFSGGEPFLQRDFILAVLKKCKEAYIHTAVETTAYTDRDFLLQAMKYIDFAFIDIKHMDPERHKEKTGVTNEIILANIVALVTSHWPGRLVIRMPVIEGFNDSEDNIIATADFMKKVGLKEINLLPFHRLGESKWRQLGMDYPYSEKEGIPEEVLGPLQDIFLERDILCYVGHDTPF
ncbi:MAG: 4-hydroxyphenylacetate decarboxylase activase [Bacillota bacterium]